MNFACGRITLVRLIKAAARLPVLGRTGPLADRHQDARCAIVIVIAWLPAFGFDARQCCETNPFWTAWSTNTRPPPSARKSQQVTGRILVSCGTRAISSNLGGTIITWFTRLFMPR